jgi:acetoin utilization protein AcuB
MALVMSTKGAKAASPKKPTRTLSGSLMIKDWMTPSPHSVGKDQPLAVAHSLMQKHELRHLPVLEQGRLIGILSQRDLYFLESIDGVNVETDPVAEAMSQDVYSVGADARVEAVIAAMAEHKYGCAVIVDRAKVLGIFTTTDALEMLAACLTERAAGANGRPAGRSPK